MVDISLAQLLDMHQYVASCDSNFASWLKLQIRLMLGLYWSYVQASLTLGIPGDVDGVGILLADSRLRVRTKMVRS